MSSSAALTIAERLKYRKDYAQLLYDHYGVVRETVEWSRLPGYENHTWDSGGSIPA